MNKELKTLKEKMMEDPNEIMENGLTRQQNDNIEKSASNISGVMGIIAVVLSFYSLYMLTQI